MFTLYLIVGIIVFLITHSIKFDENQKLKRDKVLDFFISLLFGIFWPVATIIGIIVLIFDKSNNNKNEVEK